MVVITPGIGYDLFLFEYTRRKIRNFFMGHLKSNGIHIKKFPTSDIQ